MHTRDSGGGRVGGKASCKSRADPDPLPFVADRNGHLGRARIVVAHEMCETDGLLPRACDEDVAALADAGENCEVERLQLELAETPMP